MKYFVANTNVDNLIKEIRKKIRLSMNGVVSDTMKSYGLIYKQNFGVEIPQLRQMASKYSLNHDLAQRLWALKIRETMILATLLEPAETFSEVNAEEWIKDIDNIELAEQTCMNLFSKLPFAKSWGKKLIFSDDEWVQITGYILITRISKIFENQDVEEMINQSIKLLDTENFHLYKSISVCLARLCRNGKETATLIQAKITGYKNSNKTSYKFAVNEIENELSFLGY